MKKNWRNIKKCKTNFLKLKEIASDTNHYSINSDNVQVAPPRPEIYVMVYEAYFYHL